MRYSLSIKDKVVVCKVNFVIFTVNKNIQKPCIRNDVCSNDVIIYISTSHFFHAVQILNIKKPHFKQDAFRLFSLKTFSIVHRSILSAIKIVSANSKGVNLKGLHSRCLRVEGSYSIWRLNYYRESNTDKTRVTRQN